MAVRRIGGRWTIEWVEQSCPQSQRPSTHLPTIRRFRQSLWYKVFQRRTRRNEVSREELAESYSPADLSFLILSVYALVLTWDSNWATSP
jgi:hypothetical protein